MGYVDPTTCRLSDTILLSDLMLCDSVARHGYANRFSEADSKKLEEGKCLAGTLDLLQEFLGPLSISYGYISPDLSRKIVKYQNPDKPSYHRWELGAAADICFHEMVNDDTPPIFIAHDIDDRFKYARMITYSESEWICFADSCANRDTDSYPNTFYENRYLEGERKPLFITYPKKDSGRELFKTFCPSEDIKANWRGQGHPRYHGKGRKQYHHERIGKYTNILSFLYAKDLVHVGVPNNPPDNDDALMQNWLCNARHASEVIDKICSGFGSRVSITRAYNRTMESMNWQKRFTLEIVPPTIMDIKDLSHFISGMDEVDKSSIRINSKKHSIMLMGNEEFSRDTCSSKRIRIRRGQNK